MSSSAESSTAIALFDLCSLVVSFHELTKLFSGLTSLGDDLELASFSDEL